ncbi:unnamed protein product [Gordionus sp. m RMFG-2023]
MLKSSIDFITISKRYAGRPNWLPGLLHYLKKNERKQGPYKLIPRYALYNWDFSSELYAFSKRIGQPINSDLLMKTFINPSFNILENDKILEKSKIPKDFFYKIDDHLLLQKNGEIFLKKIILRYLRYSFPRCPEEMIIDIQQYILSDENLAMISLSLGMKDLILSSTYPPNPIILTQTFNALIGSMIESVSITNNLLLEDSSKLPQNTKGSSLQLSLPNNVSNIESTIRFILDFVCTQLITLDPFELWNFQNSFYLLKSIIAKSCQENCSNKPPEIEARLLRSSGVNTIFPVYIIGIYFDKKYLAQGTGETIKTAIDQAARHALKIRFGLEYTNTGCSLTFKHSQIVQELIDSPINELKSHFKPNILVYDMMNYFVDINDTEVETKNVITGTHDDVLYHRVLN